MKKVMEVAEILADSKYRLKDALGREKVLYSPVKFNKDDSVLVVNDSIVKKVKTVVHTVYEV